MNTITNIIVYAAELFIAYTYLADMYERKFSTVKTIIIGIPLYSVAFVINQLWNNPDLNMAVFGIATAIFVIICYKATVWQGFLNGTVFTVVMMLTELICFYSVSTVLQKGTFFIYRENESVYMLCAFSSKLLFLLVCKFISRFKIKKEAKIYKFPLVYFLYAITGNIIIADLILINTQYEYSVWIRYLLILSSVLLLFNVILLFISYEKTARKNAELMELKAESQQQKLDEKHYQLLMVQNEICIPSLTILSISFRHL